MSGKILGFNSKQEIVVPAGAYFLGSTMIMMMKRPAWHQRFFAQYLLGLSWKDIDPAKYVQRMQEESRV